MFSSQTDQAVAQWPASTHLVAMNKPSLAIGMLSAFAVYAAPFNAAATEHMSEQMNSESPPALPAGHIFANPSALAFEAPDFSRIRDEDFQPAIEQGMAEHLKEIAAIAHDPAPPTIANTLDAMERSGRMLMRAYGVFSAMAGANTNPELDKVEQALAPVLAAHTDAILLDPLLFARIRALHDAHQKHPFEGEEARLLEVTYARFVQAGALLNEAQKTQLKSINGELSSLSAEFSQKLTAATEQAALVLDTAEELAGLTPAEIASATQEAETRKLPGKYVLNITNTTQQPQMTRLKNRQTRRKLYEASITRTSLGDEQDTHAIILRMAELRAQKAALLGRDDYASLAMHDRMLDSPAKAVTFMKQLVPAVARAQAAEAAELNAMIRADGKDFTVQPWDWDFYAEKLRKQQYDFDEAQTKPYFELTNVLERGAFYAARLLYGITFTRRDDLPVYHPDVRVYGVAEEDGTPLGLFYLDPFARSGKQGGAWMSNYVEQSHLLNTKPVVYNVLNIPQPSAGEPALLSHDEVITLFHEMGHALHGLFADQKYPTLSGTNTARDFVEFPSQFFENFATHPTILGHFAHHYETGAAMPAELMEKIRRAGQFNQGYALGEVLAGAMLDMRWHMRKPGFGADKAANPADVEAFEQAALAETGLRSDLVPPRYFSSYFRHIWDHGYAAGYYSYIWTEVIAHDAYAWLMDHGGGLSRAGGDLFRQKILSRGNIMDYAAMYQAYAGRQPGAEALIKARGFDQPSP